MKAYTDYPIAELGDAPGKLGHVREIEVFSFDGDKYCYIEVEGIPRQIKACYIYSQPGRHGEVPMIDTTQLPLDTI